MVSGKRQKNSRAEENCAGSRPALRQLQVNRAPRSKIHSFREHHQYRKPDADGRENDVERQRQRHLRPGKEKIAHRFGRRACWRQNSANAR